MTAAEPTILATSGGIVTGRRTTFEFGPIMHFASELADVANRRPRWVHLGTATGDQRWQNAMLSEAAEVAGVELSHLNVFPKRSVDDFRAHVLAHDVVWVSGGSIENLLVLWRLHGLDTIFKEAWEKGVILAGNSAGSICWHLGAPSNMLSSDEPAITNALGFLPYSNCVHYDIELERRETFKKLVADGTLADGYGIENGVGLLYRGTTMIEAVSEVAGHYAYLVRKHGDSSVEERLETRLLPGADAVKKAGGARSLLR